MENRKEWVDALRAFAIVLVVWGHQIPESVLFFVLTSPFKMPLFFAISGYLFKEKPIKVYTKSILSTLIFPWMILGLLPQLIICPLNGDSLGLITYLRDMISGEQLWFMPCFILSSILFYCIQRLFKSSLLRVVIVFIFFVSGYVLAKNHVMDYAMVNIALTVQPYFLFGQFFRNYESHIDKLLIGRRWLLFMGLIIIYVLSIIITLVFYPEKNLDIHVARFYNIPLCLILIFTCLLFFFTFSRFVQNYASWFTVVGRHTLVVYIWHPYAVSLVSGVILASSFTLPSFTTLFLKVVLSCTICTILSVLIGRYAPIVTGNRK